MDVVHTWLVWILETEKVFWDVIGCHDEFVGSGTLIPRDFIHKIWIASGSSERGDIVLSLIDNCTSTAGRSRKTNVIFGTLLQSTDGGSAWWGTTSCRVIRDGLAIRQC